jgi:hypothetical protein
MEVFFSPSRSFTFNKFHQSTLHIYDTHEHFVSEGVKSQFIEWEIEKESKKANAVEKNSGEKCE